MSFRLISAHSPEGPYTLREITDKDGNAEYAKLVTFEADANGQPLKEYIEELQRISDSVTEASIDTDVVDEWGSYGSVTKIEGWVPATPEEIELGLHSEKVAKTAQAAGRKQRIERELAQLSEEFPDLF